MGDYPLPEGMAKEDLGKCDHAIEVPNANYEIGVIKNKNKEGYSLYWDFWSGGKLIEHLGQNAWKLTQEYTIQQGIYSAGLEGHTYKVEELKDRKRLKNLCKGGIKMIESFTKEKRPKIGENIYLSYFKKKNSKLP